MTQEQIQAELPDYENKLTNRVLKALANAPAEGYTKGTLSRQVGGLLLPTVFELVLDRLISQQKIETIPIKFGYRLSV
jgi:hypothetical protein